MVTIWLTVEQTIFNLKCKRLKQSGFTDDKYENMVIVYLKGT